MRVSSMAMALLALTGCPGGDKDGTGEEQAVLRRERKRRRDADTAFRDAGRDDLAAKEAAEGELIDGYLPRYVIEYLPATPPADDLLPAEVRVATNPDDAAPTEGAAGGSPGIGDRLRQWTPPIFKR